MESHPEVPTISFSKTRLMDLFFVTQTFILHTVFSGNCLPLCVAQGVVRMKNSCLIVHGI